MHADACVTRLLQQSGPVVLPANRLGTHPYRFEPCNIAQIIDVPVGTCAGQEVMLDAARQATRAQSAAHVTVPAARKANLPEPPHIESGGLLHAQNQNVGSGACGNGEGQVGCRHGADSNPRGIPATEARRRLRGLRPKGIFHAEKEESAWPARSHP